MAAGTHNITIEKRATFSTTLTIKNDDNSPFDLSGAQLFAQIRKDYSNALQADFTVTIVGDAASGIITFSLTKAQTAALSTAPSSYDIFVNNADGTSDKIIKGSVTIVENETQTGVV